MKASLNCRQNMDGRELLSSVPEGGTAAVFFDPQYRGLLDKLKYGNEGATRGKKRKQLRQMTELEIKEFIWGIARILQPSGHLFLWVDKFHLNSTARHGWFSSYHPHNAPHSPPIHPLGAYPLTQVDMLTWDKGRFGMGYRTRQQCEYILIYQKSPVRAKNIWTDRSLPDIVKEKVKRGEHPHPKPVELQQRLIEASTKEGDLVVDPAAGSYSVLSACQRSKRNFLGCDLED